MFDIEIENNNEISEIKLDEFTNEPYIYCPAYNCAWHNEDDRCYFYKECGEMR